MLTVSYMEAASASHSSPPMHNPSMGQMDVEGSGHHPQPEDFPPAQWGTLAAFPASPQHSPLHEFNGFNFMHHSREVSMASMDGTVGRMEPPATVPSAPAQLETPTVEPQWPNMMAERVEVSYVPASSLSASPPTRSARRGHTSRSSQPIQRKTLSDADRRRMCVYHEENPNIKQTEIGAMFGVERSTVSKVLRQKEKYLFPDDEEEKSPVKRSKGRFPDIEKALSNWARNSQKQGILVSDAMIKEKARFFATTVGSNESHIKLKDVSWLEKFKQKNNLSAMKVMKRSGKHSRQNESTRRTPDAPAISRTSSGISVSSPDSASPHALSIKRETSTKPSSPETFLSFDQSYQQPNNQSNPSLASPFDEMGNSFGASASPAYYPPDQGSQGPFLHQPQARMSTVSPYSRPRSQTFPVLGGDASFNSTPSSSEPLTPKFMIGSQVATFQSALEEMLPPLNPMNSSSSLVQQPASSSPAPHHRHTNTSPAMLPPQNPHSNLQHGHHHHHLHSINHQESHGQLHSPPEITNSPSQEDACKAMELVMQFIHHQPMASVDQNEYMVMGKLMQRLRLRRHSIGSNLGQIAESAEVGTL